MNWVRLAAFILTASAEALASDASPHDGATGSCSSSYNGKFEVTINKLGKRDSEQKRSCGDPDALLLTLKGGILKDAKNRTGYIASNYQLQFDEPTQPDAIYTSGFSSCSNGLLALRGSTTFYQCRSGNFYNLYDRNWAAQCEPVDILIMSCDGNTQWGEGNGRGSATVGTKPVHTAIVYGLPNDPSHAHNAGNAFPICQIGDGQPQVHEAPCNGGSPASPGGGQVPSEAAPTKPPAAVPTATGAHKQSDPPVTQLPDGQPKAPPAGTNAAPKPSPSASAEVPVNGAARLSNDIMVTIGILMLYYMGVGV
ncbi:hypothetical protein ACSS6W_006074 [Trichoderma asperelloides]